MKRLAIIAAFVVLGIGLCRYSAYQKSLLERVDAEIWSNVKASTAAYNITLEKKFRVLNKEKTISSRTSMMGVLIMMAEE